MIFFFFCGHCTHQYVATVALVSSFKAAPYISSAEPYTVLGYEPVTAEERDRAGGLSERNEETQSIWKHIAAQHAKTNQQLSGWHCNKRRRSQSTAKENTQPDKCKLSVNPTVSEDHLFWHFKICSLTGYGPKLWKQFYWKRSPKHMSSTEDHIKLAAIEACSFLRHLCRFLQPWLFQQKLAWQRRRENGRNITQGLLKRHSGIHRRGILPLAQVKGQTGLALYNNMKSEFSTPPFLGWISATLAQISRPW